MVKWSANHNSTEVRTSQEEDVTGNLNVDRDVLPRPHVYQAASRAGLDNPVPGEESDGTQTGLVCLDFLKIIQSMDRFDLTEKLMLTASVYWTIISNFNSNLADLHLLFTQIWSFNCTLLFLKDFFFNFFLWPEVDFERNRKYIYYYIWIRFIVNWISKKLRAEYHFLTWDDQNFSSNMKSCCHHKNASSFGDVSSLFIV